MAAPETRRSEAAQHVGEAAHAPSAMHADGAPAPASHSLVSSHPSAQPAPPKRRWWLWMICVAVLAGGALASLPWLQRALATVSTDDAYVSGHVTFVAPRVGGQVALVLVDDNNRVRKGDLLVELDEEPYRVQVDIAKAAVDTAQSNVVAAQALVRGNEGLARSLRFGLQHAIEEVDDQVATLKLRVATLESKKASLAKTQADYNRAKPLVGSGAVTQQALDAYTEAMLVAQAQVREAYQSVYQVRAMLGLPPEPENDSEIAKVPADLNQTFSTVREAQARLIQAAAQLGVVGSFNQSPKEMVTEFYKRDPSGDIDRIYAALLKDAPSVKQAEAELMQAQRNLDQADLNLRYCKVLAEIDGVVTRRSVNPGNNVTAGQSLMAVRSIDEIWVDANFKETQLGELRIGQPVTLEVDMYGRHQEFAGRISGFTMGTGSTLSLLPAQNATGNFVKVVQRLPVRIDIVDYQPTKSPLFIGLSVTPRVHIKEQPTGPNAGMFLQDYLAQPTTAQPPVTQPPSTAQPLTTRKSEGGP